MPKYMWTRIVIAAMVVGFTVPSHALVVKSGYAMEDDTHKDNVTFTGTPTITVPRKVLHIPQDYGKIIGVFPDTNGIVFWFESGDGQVRNLTIIDAREPVVIRRRGKLE